MYLIFDTETTGIPRNKTAPLTDFENWPRLVQIAWQLHDSKGKLLAQHNYIIKPDGFDIPFKAEQVHGISTIRALTEGRELSEVLNIFERDLENTKQLIGHNIEFDINIIGAE
ncbi:MAG: exonuclease domain-containing protein, partial [Cytophagales bacterium]